MDIPQVKTKDNVSKGDMGQEYLASGKEVALRIWEEQRCDFSKATRRQYETVGYVVEGELQLNLDGQIATLRAGDSWLVPAGSMRSYRIVEPILAIEATCPPARFNDRDHPPD
ncbi:MAG: cupin domain-containing protein [Pirellulaceae bacterium]